jgi:hypothetical protein
MPFNRHWDHDYEHGHAHSTQLGSWLSTQSCPQ